MIGVYAPNGPKEVSFTKLKQRPDQENYEQVIMMGDFNRVINPRLDKKPKRRKGKLPNVFIEITEQEQLVDIWREWNVDKENFTYYSPNKKAFSRIDMFWISKKLATLTSKIEILPKSGLRPQSSDLDHQIESEENIYMEVK